MKEYLESQEYKVKREVALKSQLVADKDKFQENPTVNDANLQKDTVVQQNVGLDMQQNLAPFVEKQVRPRSEDNIDMSRIMSARKRAEEREKVLHKRSRAKDIGGGNEQQWRNIGQQGKFMGQQMGQVGQQGQFMGQQGQQGQLMGQQMEQEGQFMGQQMGHEEQQGWNGGQQGQFMGQQMGQGMEQWAGQQGLGQQMPNMGRQFPNAGQQQVPGFDQQMQGMGQQALGVGQQVPNMEQQFPEMNQQLPDLRQQMLNLGQQMPVGDNQQGPLAGQQQMADQQFPGQQQYLQNMGGQIPNLGGQIPNMVEQGPIAGQQIPNYIGDLPNAREQVPNMGGQVPNMAGQVPNMGGQVPNMGGQVPNIGELLPNQGGQVPNMGGQVADIEGQGPNVGGQVPIEQKSDKREQYVMEQAPIGQKQNVEQKKEELKRGKRDDIVQVDGDVQDNEEQGEAVQEKEEYDYKKNQEARLRDMQNFYAKKKKTDDDAQKGVKNAGVDDHVLKRRLLSVTDQDFYRLNESETQYKYVYREHLQQRTSNEEIVRIVQRLSTAAHNSKHPTHNTKNGKYETMRIIQGYEGESIMKKNPPVKPHVSSMTMMNAKTVKQTLKTKDGARVLLLDEEDVPEEQELKRRQQNKEKYSRLTSFLPWERDDDVLHNITQVCALVNM